MSINCYQLIINPINWQLIISFYQLVTSGLIIVFRLGVIVRTAGINPTNQESITVQDQTIEEVQKFTVCKEGDVMEDLKNRLSKARNALRKYGDLVAYQEEPNLNFSEL